MTLSRRQLLGSVASIAGAAVLGPWVTGCHSSSGTSAAQRLSAEGSLGPAASTASSGTVASGLRSVIGNAQQVQLTPAQSVNATGSDTFTFGLLLSTGEFIEGGTPQVWLARGENTPVLGPYPASWHTLSSYASSGDHSPVTTLPGFYAAEIHAPQAGKWFVAVVADSGQARAAGVVTITVADRVPAAVGSKALATPTPVASTAAGLSAICTREPPDPLHYISLDRAIRASMPVVACFATPLLCESRMCAPVLDEVLAVYRTYHARAAFVHIEEYPQRDTSRVAPAFTAWGFTTEPWTVLIDRGGVIRAHFEGPVSAVQIAAALAPLL